MTTGLESANFVLYPYSTKTQNDAPSFGSTHEKSRRTGIVMIFSISIPVQFFEKEKRRFRFRFRFSKYSNRDSGLTPVSMFPKDFGPGTGSFRYASRPLSENKPLFLFAPIFLDPSRKTTEVRSVRFYFYRTGRIAPGLVHWKITGGRPDDRRVMQ